MISRQMVFKSYKILPTQVSVISPWNFSLIYKMARTACVGIQSLFFTSFFFSGPPYIDSLLVAAVLRVLPEIEPPADFMVARIACLWMSSSSISPYSVVSFKRARRRSLSYLSESSSICSEPFPFLEQ